jgi:hypothetical protein
MSGGMNEDYLFTVCSSYFFPVGIFKKEKNLPRVYSTLVLRSQFNSKHSCQRNS